jgi:murein biosynthesis integral membrane protein MurJ
MSGGSLVRAGLIVSVVTLLGRVSGLVREMALARSMGAGEEADVAVLLLALPDLLTQVLAAGAIVAVLLPVYQAAGVASPESAALFRRFTAWALGLGLCLGAGVWAGTSLVLLVLAPGFSEWQQGQAAAGLAVVAWTLPIAIASAVTAAWLQAQSRFVIVTAGTLLFNGAVIAALLLAPGSFTALGAGLVAAVSVRWTSQVIALGRVAWQKGPIALVSLPDGLWRRYAEATGAAAVVFAAPLVARALASLASDGTVAVLHYATRVLEVPMGLAIGVVPVVLFPKLSAAFSANNQPRFHTLLSDGWIGMVALSVPVAGTLLVFGDVAARAVFALSGFEETAVSAIGQSIALGAVGLPALGAAFLYQSALNARLDTRGPLIASAVYLGLLVVSGRPAVAAGGGAGLVLALSACQWALAGVLAWRLWRVHDLPPVSGAMVAPAAWVAVGTVTVVTVAGWLVRGASVWPRLIAAAGAGAAALALSIGVLNRAGLPLPWKGGARAL